MLFGALAAVLSMAAALAEEGVSYPDHTILTNVNILTMGRIDPIVDPGKVGSHVHTILGASNFRSNLNMPAEQQRAVCTTARVQADKSSYWTPTLYYIHENNTYEALTPHNTRIYYFTRNETNMHPFPPGMRIVSGTAMSRDVSDIRTRGVELSCGGPHSSPYLPNGTSNPNGCDLHVGIRFPSCGLASGALDSEDHFSHLTWPIYYGSDGPNIDTNGAVCPESHPIHYPTLFMQAFYKFDNFRPWKAGRNNVVWSNGDTLGSSFHGDFVNGWDEQVLDNFVKQCNTPHGTGDQPQNCPAWAPTHDPAASANCSMQGQVPAEDIGLYRAIPELPGCNPIWNADGGLTHPMVGGSCNKPSPGWTAPNFFLGLNDMRRIPVYLKDEAGKNYTDLAWNQPDVVTWVGRWGGPENQANTEGGIAYGNTFGHPEVITSPEITQSDSVAGMQDTAVFSQDSGTAVPAVSAAGANVTAGSNSTDTSNTTVEATAGNSSASEVPIVSASDAATASPSATEVPAVDSTNATASATSTVAEIPANGGALVADHPVNVDGTPAVVSHPNASTAASAPSGVPSATGASSIATSTGAAASGTSSATYGASSNVASGASAGTGPKKCNRRRRSRRTRL